MWTIPNILTYLRILLIPVLFVMMYDKDFIIANYYAAGVFAFAAITDFFDGYLSRKLNQYSEIGRFLDPIADKLIVCAALFALTQVKFMGMLETSLAVVIICREIFVSGLREYLGNLNIKVHVTKLAKWKTTSQLIALTLLILGAPNAMQRFLIPDCLFNIYVLGQAFLIVSAMLTVITGAQYFTVALKHMNKPVAKTKTPVKTKGKSKKKK